MKKIVLLGASGSLGKQTLDIVEQHRENFEIIALSVGRNVDFLRSYLRNNHPQYACIGSEEDYEQLCREFPEVTFCYGDEGLLLLAGLKCDLLINNLQGFVGLKPTLTAINNGSNIALANKETLVAGGYLVDEACRKNGIQIMPIDSEHAAIYQCLLGNERREVNRLIITASGGSLRDLTREELADVTVERALAHPNWSMGQKITIDSSTMMNKGFEVIEAHWLYDIPYEKIDVIQHRESVIHSMVEFIDHSVMAQLAVSDMRICIQYAMSFPQRLPNTSRQLDLAEYGTLHFEKMDFERFPLLKLAYEMGKMEGNMGAVMNGANEMAVRMFLNRQCSYLDIEKAVFASCRDASYIKHPELSDIIESDRWAQDYVLRLLKG